MAEQIFCWDELHDFLSDTKKRAESSNRPVAADCGNLSGLAMDDHVQYNLIESEEDDDDGEINIFDEPTIEIEGQIGYEISMGEWVPRTLGADESEEKIKIDPDDEDDDDDDDDDYFDDEDDQPSWVMTGAALLAAGVISLASSTHKPRRKEKLLKDETKDIVIVSENTETQLTEEE
jgi:hypothetical protein